jgi:hypothetical protein
MIDFQVNRYLCQEPFPLRRGDDAVAARFLDAIRDGSETGWEGHAVTPA